MLVSEAMEKYYAHQVDTENDEDWDTTALHSSDLSFCPTKIHARRNGLLTKFVNFDSRRQMEFGKIWEVPMANILRHAGLEFFEQVEVKGKLFGVDIECHGDFDVPSQDLYIEAKTTEYWKGWLPNKGGPYYKTPDKPKPYHLTQAAASAMLLGRSNIIISDTGRNNGGHAEFEFETIDLIPLVQEAVLNRAETRPGDEAPLISEPSFDWECNSCGLAECKKNKNPFLQVI